MSAIPAKIYNFWKKYNNKKQYLYNFNNNNIPNFH